MKAMILAAGKGTRVQPITHTIPKPMIPILQKPVMEFLLELLRQHGFTEVMVNVSHLAEEIESILDFELSPIYLDSRPSEVKLAHCSAEKARKLLNYETHYELKEILTSMVEWVASRGTGSFNFNLPVEIKNYLTPKTWVNQDIFNK